jgi:hypothetical protein
MWEMVKARIVRECCTRDVNECGDVSRRAKSEII